MDEKDLTRDETPEAAAPVPDAAGAGGGDRTPGAARAKKPALGPLVFAALLLATVATRFYDLDYRAFHHDEGIHCKYSWSKAKQGLAIFPYDPVYHGPFLYLFGAAFMKALPDTDFAARVPYALIGVLLVGIFVWWKRLLGWGPPLLIMALLLVSPITDYYSRFARNDVYMMAWLAGALVTGTLYLKTARVRYLTWAIFFIVMSYVTKENSYVNNFFLCAFVAIWWLWRLIRKPAQAMQEAFVRYLPLTRFLVLFGCFSLFVFSYVAIDTRIGPETGLVPGVKRIVSVALTLTEKTSDSVFQGQQGYFTKEGQEAVKANYLRIAFAVPLVLLVLVEILAHRVARRRWTVAAIGTGLAAVIFYYATANFFVGLGEWAPGAEREHFMQALGKRLVGGMVILGLLALLMPVPDFILLPLKRRQMPPPESEEDGDFEGFVATPSRFRRVLDLWLGSIVNLWALVLQLMIAAGIYLTLFTSLGYHTRHGARDGLYKYIEYWFKHQTGSHRIWGVWWYYIPRLLLYEILPLALIALGIALAVRAWLRRRDGQQTAGAVRKEAAETPAPQTQSSLGRSKRKSRRARKVSPPDESAPKPAANPEPAPAPVAQPAPPSDGFWRPVPLPLRIFSGLLLIYMVGLYAILHEKVPWLTTYQAFAANLFAALLIADWLARHPYPGGAIIGRLREFGQGGREDTARRADTETLIARGALFGVLALLLLFTIGQHVCAVYARPDAPSELLVYTGTTHEFHDAMLEIRGEMEKAKEEGRTVTVSFQGDGENVDWPATWYLRNQPIQWGRLDPKGDIQIMADKPQLRRQLQGRQGKVWDIQPIDLRAWWHANTGALPGGPSIFKNIIAFLTNAPNNHRMAFPPEKRPDEYTYPTGFMKQIRDYVFRRRNWSPTGAFTPLLCRKTSEDMPEVKVDSFLEGSGEQAKRYPGTKQFGAKGSGPGEMDSPRGVAVTPDGNIAVADSKNGRVQVFSRDGEFLYEFGKDVLNAEYTGPCDVACDSEGNFYVADTWNHCVRKFTPKGRLLVSASTGKHLGNEQTFWGPRGVAVGPDGSVYITDTGKKMVRKFNKMLLPELSWGGEGDGAGFFIEPVGIVVDPQGRVYVADTGNGRVQRFSADGEYQAEYATTGPAESQLTSLEPHLALTPDGRLIETFSLEATFWVIDPEAKRAAIYTPRDPDIPRPLGVDVSPEGWMVISDIVTGRLTILNLPK